jgi:multicomponent Na+:H+ antiporter subunit G
MTIVEWLGAVLLLAGLVFVLAGVIGVLRLPDFYARLHATSKCDTLGLALMVAGIALQAGPTLAAGKILLLAVFVGILNATAAHALGRAAHRSGLAPWVAREITVPDE